MHNTTTKEDCNTCTCYKGTRTCTKVDCGPRNCNSSDPLDASVCQDGDVCKAKETNCLKPPCAEYGVCMGVTSTSIGGGGGVIRDDFCLPNSTSLSGDCAKINILFNLQKIPNVRITNTAHRYPSLRAYCKAIDTYSQNTLD
jgi:hypothetical protein